MDSDIIHLPVAMSVDSLAPEDLLFLLSEAKKTRLDKKEEILLTKIPEDTPTFLGRT